MRVFWLFGLLVVSLLCAGYRVLALEVVPPTGAGGPTDLRAYLRFVNLTVEMPSIDFALDRHTVASALCYGSATDYLAQQTSHPYVLSYRLTGVSTLTSSAAMEVMLYPQYYYTVVAVGKVAEPSLWVLDDDPSTPPGGKARVRFINATRGALTLSAGNSVVFSEAPCGVTSYALVAREICGYAISSPCDATLAATLQLPARHSRVYTIVAFSDGEKKPLRALVLQE